MSVGGGRVGALGKEGKNMLASVCDKREVWLRCEMSAFGAKERD